MLYPDIQKALELIDAKILELQNARQTLIEAFGGMEANSISSRKIKPQIIRRKKFTRKDALIKLLKDEGPLSHAEILEKSGIPRGTVSTLLNEKTMFFNKNRKWYLVKKEENQEDKKEKGLTE